MGKEGDETHLEGKKRFDAVCAKGDPNDDCFCFYTLQYLCYFLSGDSDGDKWDNLRAAYNR